MIGYLAGTETTGSEGSGGIRVALLPYDITEADLVTIGKLNSLRVLVVGGRYVNDTTIRHLANLKNLEYLYLGQSEVSDEGIAWLKGALPSVTITPMSVPYWN